MRNRPRRAISIYLAIVAIAAALGFAGWLALPGPGPNRVKHSAESSPAITSPSPLVSVDGNSPAATAPVTINVTVIPPKGIAINDAAWKLATVQIMTIGTNGVQGFGSVSEGNAIAAGKTESTLTSRDIPFPKFEFRVAVLRSSKFRYEGSASRQIDVANSATFNTPLVLQLINAPEKRLQFQLISGATGKPMAGYKCYLEDRTRGMVAIAGDSGVSDAAGKLELSAVTTHSYELYVSDPFPQELWRQILIGPAEIAHASDLWEIKTGIPSIVGQLVLKSGNPPTTRPANIDGPVSVMGPMGPNHSLATCYARGGVFYAYNLAPGHYDVKLIAENPAFENLVLDGNAGFDVTGKGSLVALNVVLRARAGLPCMLTVTDGEGGSGIKDADVKIFSRSGPIRSGKTNDSGKFDAGTLMEGSYPVEITAAGFRTTDSTIDVTKAASLVIALEKTRDVTIRVLDEGSKPLAGASVVLCDPRRVFEADQVTNSAGTATFKDVEARTDIVAVIARSRVPELLYIGKLAESVKDAIVKVEPRVSVEGAIAGQISAKARFDFVSIEFQMPVARPRADKTGQISPFKVM